MKIPEFVQTISVSGYRVLLSLQRVYWKLAGGRKEVVFGKRYRFTSSTHFPSFRGLRFPEREIFSTIVRYGDYVQTHAAALYIDELAHPPVVVDCGAHHGIYAVLLGKSVQQKKGKVIALEPNPSAFRILQKNVKLNGLEDTVICENIGIMDRDGELTIADDDDQSRILEPGKQGGFRVKVSRLSEVAKRYSLATVDLLIIDVEGAELNVLRSIDWKGCAVHRIFCEFHPYNWKFFGYTGKDVSQFLSVHGYRCFDMYLREHKEFNGEAYLGPTILIPDRS